MPRGMTSSRDTTLTGTDGCVSGAVTTGRARVLCRENRVARARTGERDRTGVDHVALEDPARVAGSEPAAAGGGAARVEGPQRAESRVAGGQDQLQQVLLGALPQRQGTSAALCRRGTGAAGRAAARPAGGAVGAGRPGLERTGRPAAGG